MSGFNYLNTRQILNNAALSNVGTTANTSLDAILTAINNVLADVTASTGYIAKQVSLTSGTTSISVTISEQADTSYIVLGLMGNITDSYPQYQQITVTSKSTTGFTFEWNHPLDSSNYFINYIIPYKFIPVSESAVGSNQNSVSLNLPLGYSGEPILAALQDTVDTNPQFQSVVLSQNTSETLVTVQTFLSGSGTYITPNNVAYIEVEMVGGGGGGAGAGGSGDGGNGGNTTFGTSLLIANGGGGGLQNSGTGGPGGTATIASGILGVAFTGANGIPGGNTASGTLLGIGGAGGSSPFGGAGSPGQPNDGVGSSASPNTGSGGGGASNDQPSNCGGGGSAGGYIKAIIVSPNSSYSYSVGTGGTAGGSGGNGAAGIIIVKEYYFNGLNATQSQLSWNAPTDSSNYKLVNAIGGSGQVAISNGATSVTVNLPVNYNSTNYIALATIQNTLDEYPQYQPIILSAQTDQSVTFSWNVGFDSGNYLLNYYAISITS